MRIRTLYRCLLSLPLLVPGLLLPLKLFHIAPSWLETFIGISGLSIAIGGIPYALLAFSLLLWMRRKPERQIRMAMFSAPVLMVVLLGLAIVAMVALEGSPFDFDDLTAWAVYSGYALALGYFYVALACFVVWLARRTGRVGNDGDTLLPNHRMQATTGGLTGRSRALAMIKNPRVILGLAIRIAGAFAAAGSFLAGLWIVFTQPALGFGLMGFGIVAGVVFGRVPKSQLDIEKDDG